MITRFAPSPTGPLHLGHAYSALLAYDAAKAEQGTFLLRIEDTDSTRCKPEFTSQIYDDLSWLGLEWPEPRVQSRHREDYWKTLRTLEERGLLFPCSCNRKRIIVSGLGFGPDGPIYDGQCETRSIVQANATDAIRLNLANAVKILPDTLQYIDTGKIVEFSPQSLVTTVGAPILRRIMTGDPAYHLACVHDDAAQGVTHIIRGEDVASLTPIHVVLQTLMGWPTPTYTHHTLITDDAGKRLAKINKSRSIATYRADGASPADIRRMVGLA